jgi:lipoprotein-releasing system permease protein
MAARIAEVPGVTRAAPLIKGKLMVSDGEDTTGAEVYGMLPEDLRQHPAVGAGADAIGELARFPEGIALGSGIARELGVTVGDRVRLIRPTGASRRRWARRPGSMPMRWSTSSPPGAMTSTRTRIYMPFIEAQSFFNKEGRADEIEVMVETPDAGSSYGPAIWMAAGPSRSCGPGRTVRGSFPAGA